MNKISLDVLKKLVAALENGLEVSEKIRDNAVDGSTDGLSDYILEMSKSAGIAMGIMQEATLLVGDIQHMVKGATSPKPSGAIYLDELMSKIKGDGTKN